MVTRGSLFYIMEAVDLFAQNKLLLLWVFALIYNVRWWLMINQKDSYFTDTKTSQIQDVVNGVLHSSMINYLRGYLMTCFNACQMLLHLWYYKKNTGIHYSVFRLTQSYISNQYSTLEIQTSNVLQKWSICVSEHSHKEVHLRCCWIRLLTDSVNRMLLFGGKMLFNN